MKATWYDKNENTVFKTLLKQLENDENKLSEGEGNLKQLTDKESTIFIKNLNDEYFIGKSDTKDNVHKKYSFAKLLNKYNLDSMGKMKMVVTLYQANFAIKRFQNIRLDIYNPEDMFSNKAATKSPADSINSTLSGYWYVTGIDYTYKRSGGVEQEITLMRRDLSIDYGNSSKEKNDLRAVTPPPAGSGGK
jgi:hypothetical protein